MPGWFTDTLGQIFGAVVYGAILLGFAALVGSVGFLPELAMNAYQGDNGAGPFCDGPTVESSEPW
jgi:hypothetical protein